MKKAVAVKYRPEKKKDAPKVVTKGQGSVADKIIQKAKELGIYTYEDRDAVEILSRVNLGDEIPAELFETVAEILVFAYRINKKYPKFVRERKQ